MAKRELTGMIQGKFQTMNVADLGRSHGKTVNVAYHRHRVAQTMGLESDQQIIDYIISDQKKIGKFFWRRTDPKTKPFYDMFNLGIPLEINHG